MRRPRAIRDRAIAINPRRACLRGARPLVLFLALGACARGEPLTPAGLSEAKARWGAHATGDYDVHLEIEGDLVQEGDFDVQVRGGKVIAVQRNGDPVGTRDAFYSVDGMFEFLREELEMAGEPARFWGAAADARIFQRALFDEATGYPRRYLRAVGGTQHNIVITAELQVRDVAADPRAAP